MTKLFVYLMHFFHGLNKCMHVDYSRGHDDWI